MKYLHTYIRSITNNRIKTTHLEIYIFITLLMSPIAPFENEIKRQKIVPDDGFFSTIFFVFQPIVLVLLPWHSSSQVILSHFGAL